jgi:hypothetical protein
MPPCPDAPSPLAASPAPVAALTAAAAAAAATSALSSTGTNDPPVLVASAWQLRHTRCGCVYPSRGNSTFSAAHFLQKMDPQCRQWCLQGLGFRV